MHNFSWSSSSSDDENEKGKKKIKCPYEGDLIERDEMEDHLDECRRRHPPLTPRAGVAFMCRHNKNHKLPRLELRVHESYLCPDRRKQKFRRRAEIRALVPRWETEDPVVDDSEMGSGAETGSECGAGAAISGPGDNTTTTTCTGTVPTAMTSSYASGSVWGAGIARPGEIDRQRGPGGGLLEERERSYQRANSSKWEPFSTNASAGSTFGAFHPRSSGPFAPLQMPAPYHPYHGPGLAGNQGQGQNQNAGQGAGASAAAVDNVDDEYDSDDWSKGANHPKFELGDYSRIGPHMYMGYPPGMTKKERKAWKEASIKAAEVRERALEELEKQHSNIWDPTSRPGDLPLSEWANMQESRDLREPGIASKLVDDMKNTGGYDQDVFDMLERMALEDTEKGGSGA